MTNTLERNINLDDKINLLESVLQQTIIYDEASVRTKAWEQISADTGISVTQCMIEWEKLRKGLYNHKDKVYTNGKIDWQLAKDFLKNSLEKKKLKDSMTSPSAAPSPAPTLTPSSAPSTSSKVPIKDEAQITEDDAQNSVENPAQQQLNIKPRLDALEFIVKRLPAEDAEQLVTKFTELAINSFK